MLVFVFSHPQLSSLGRLAVDVPIHSDSRSSYPSRGDTIKASTDPVFLKKGESYFRSVGQHVYQEPHGASVVSRGIASSVSPDNVATNHAEKKATCQPRNCVPSVCQNCRRQLHLLLAPAKEQTSQRRRQTY